MKLKLKLAAFFIERMVDMSDVKSFLAGKKTYLVSIAGIIGAVIAYSQNEITLGTLLQMVLTALSASALKSAVKKVE